MIRILLLLFSVLLFLVPGDLQGQIIYGQHREASGRLVHQSWTLTDKSGTETKISQSALPLYGFLPIADNWEVHFTTAFSRSNFNQGSTEISLSTLLNPTFEIYRSFSDDRIFASVGILLPTSKTKLDSLERLVAELVAIDYLNLPIKRVGEGAGLIFQVGGTERYEQVLFGGALRYYHTGSYTYLKDGQDYSPGDEILVRGSATMPVDNGRVNLDLGYKYLMTDKVEDVEMFKDGGQFIIDMSGEYNFTATRLELGFQYISRDRNSHQYGEVFRFDSLNVNGRKTILNGSAQYQFKPDISGSVFIGYRIVSANDYSEVSALYFGKSDLFSIGIGGTYKPNDSHYSIFSRLVFSTGSANDGLIDISGTEFTVGGRIEL